MRALLSLLLAFSLVAQAAQEVPELVPGTVVTLLPPDLVGAYATAVVDEDRRLVFADLLEPETEVRVLIMLPGVEATSAPPYGRVSPSGDDIYVQFEGSAQAVSLRRWFAEAYGVALSFSSSEGDP